MTKFKPGQSGNPKGRPKGAKNRYTEIRQTLINDLPELLEATKEAALSGDMTAMRLLLERTIPPQKATAPTVDVFELVQAQTMTAKAQALLSAIGEGSLPPDIGANLLTALGQMAKLIEIDELTHRIKLLEDIENEQAK